MLSHYWKFIAVSSHRTGLTDSSIVEVDPVSFESRKILDGANYGFYTPIRGKHQELPSGARMITSFSQGRAFEVADDGTVVFDFINRYSDQEVLVLTEAKFLSLDYFDSVPMCGGAADGWNSEGSGKRREVRAKTSSDRTAAAED